MLNRLFFASLVPLFLSATADARRLAPAPIFEIETVAAETHSKITAERIFVNGHWTIEDFRSKTPRTTSGHVTDEQMRALRAELAKAPWQHTYSHPPCARPTTETHYSVNGKVVFSEPACGDKLDDESLRVLAYARGFVDGAMVAPNEPPPPPPPPPTCEITGAPLVVLANKTDALALYRSGAVTHSPTNGSKRPTTKE